MNPFDPRHWIVRTGLLLLGLAIFLTQAQDAPLQTPKGSALLRLYNASDREASATVGGNTLSGVAPFASSDFLPLEPGQYTATIGAQQQQVTLQPERMYTLVNRPGAAPQLVEEPNFKSREKALLRLQNLSDRPLALKTADGKTEVVASVAPQGRGEREINPMEVGVALYEGERKIADLPPVVLESGEAVCLYVTGSAGSLTPVWVECPVRE